MIQPARIAALALCLSPIAAAAAPLPAAPAASGIIALPLNPVVGNGERGCTAKSASGLGSLVLRSGSGATPAAGDYVLINYIGYLASSGEVFDQAMRTPMPVDGVITGFSEGLKSMPRGSIARFCIPAALGYGDKPSGPIPANSDLVFQVELLDFKTAAEIAAAQAAQDKSEDAVAAASAAAQAAKEAAEAAVKAK